MRGISRLAAVALTIAPIATAGAQTIGSGNVFQVAPYVGYMIFGNYLDGPLGTSLTSSAAPVYGAQLGMRLTPNLVVLGNVASSQGDLKVGVPFLGSTSVGTNSLLIYDADLQLDLGTAGDRDLSFSPFLQAGIGGIRYDIQAVSILRTQATNTAYNVGGGADIALGKGFGMRLMAKDYIGRFDFQDATSLDIQGRTAHNFALSAGVRIDF